MFTEQFLKRLGFTDFEHLDKAKRDSKQRLYAVVYVENACFTIRLVKNQNTWEIEQFNFEGKETIFENYFSSKPDLKCIIDTLFFGNEPPEDYQLE